MKLHDFYQANLRSAALCFLSAILIGAGLVGEVYANQVASTTNTVKGRIPVNLNPYIEGGVRYPTDSVLRGRYTFFDADGDRENRTVYSWWRNGGTIEGGQAVPTKTILEDDVGNRYSLAVRPFTDSATTDPSQGDQAYAADVVVRWDMEALQAAVGIQGPYGPTTDHGAWAHCRDILRTSRASAAQMRTFIVRGSAASSTPVNSTQYAYNQMCTIYNLCNATTDHGGSLYWTDVDGYYVDLRSGVGTNADRNARQMFYCKR